MNIQYTDVKEMIAFLKDNRVTRFKCAEFEVEICIDYSRGYVSIAPSGLPVRDPLAIELDDPPEPAKEPTEDELLFYSARG